MPSPLDCCSVVVGGFVKVVATLEGGGRYEFEGMGEVRIQPANEERTAGASSAGRLWITVAPKPFRALLSFVNRCGYDPLVLFNERCHLQIDIYEISRGIHHVFINAVAVGTPEVNLTTGEISGLEIVSDNYDTDPPRNQQAVGPFGANVPVEGAGTGGIHTGITG